MAAKRVTDDPSDLLQHASWLRRLAYSLVRDDAEADELVQDTWLAAMRRPPALDESPRPWLRRVVTNVARFRWRGDRNRAAREDAVATTAEDASMSPDELLQRHELQQLLSRLVTELEEPFRTTLLLRYAEGLTPSAIARRLGVPAGTVRSRLHEALERLRVQLDSLHRGDRRAWIVAFAPFGRRPGAAIGSTVAAVVLTVATATLVVLAVWLFRDEDRHIDARDASSSRAVPALRRATDVGSTSRTVPGWMRQDGSVSRRVAGQVVDDGGPVAGARVVLTSDVARAGLAPVDERITDSSGRFDFGLQPARVAELGASTPGMLAAIEHVDVRDPRAATEAVRLTLRPCMGALYGTITDAKGAPIPDADVLRQDVIGVKTGDAGTYELCMRQQATAPELLRVVVRAKGYGSLMLDAGLAGRERHDFVMTPEAVIEGRATTPDGVPIADVRLLVDRADSETRQQNEQPARLVVVTRTDGRFRVEGVAGGELRIRGAGGDYTASTQVLRVAPGEHRNVHIVMNRAAAIRGRVVANGRPIAGARVGVEPGGEMVARTQADGTFALDGIPAGAVTVVVDAQRVRAPSLLTLAAGEVRDITVEVEPLARAQGVVRWRGVPVPGARVCAGRDGGRNVCTTADPSGRYSLEGLEPGSYRGFADDEVVGAALYALQFTIEDGVNRELDIDLRAGSRVSGIVIDADGVAVSAAVVELSSRASGNATRCVSDAGGRFECVRLAAGRHRATVYAGPGQLIPLRFVDAPADVVVGGEDVAVRDVRIVVDASRFELRGTVVDATGAARSDARVRVWARAALEPNWFDAVPSSATDEEGAFRIAGLAAGEYTAEVQVGAERSLHPVTVSRDAPTIRLVVDDALCRNAALAPAGDPLREAITSREPDAIGTRPGEPIVWDHSIELIGWDLLPRVDLGDPFEMALYFKVLAPMDRSWRVFVHFDGPIRVGRADHEPIEGRCATSSWQPGQFVRDRFTVEIPKTDYAAAGTYDVWVGFYTGIAPTWINLPLSEVPASLHDQRYHRVKIGSISISIE